MYCFTVNYLAMPSMILTPCQVQARLELQHVSDLESSSCSILAGKARAQGNHVVIKTHQWSDAWECQQADHIFLTHRNLQEVVASYRRVGWAFNIPDSYVEEHQLWRVS